MDVNSRDPSQNILPFRIKGVDVARFDTSGNLGIGTVNPTARLEVIGDVKINSNAYNTSDTVLMVNGLPIENKTTVVVNMDSQPSATTALNRQKKQSIPLAVGSTLATSNIVAKMSGVSVGKSQTYGVGASQMASYGNIVVAVGEGTNSIAYSLVNPPTASSWVGIPNSAATFTTRGRNIAYANGTWVAVGEGTNSIAYSTTTPPVASSWVGIPNNIVFNGVTTRNTFNVGWDIAYGNGAWVAVGGGTNSIAYSLANPPTAESWVGITINSSTNFGTEGYGITFGNGTWVATGFGTNGIAYSTRTPPTADSWVVVPLTNSNDAGSTNTPNNWSINIIYANGVWLVAGDTTNVMCYSLENPPIAGSWMPITTSILFGQRCRAIAYGNGTWVACGDSGTLLAYSTARIPHSSSWVSMKGPTPSSSGEQINHITFNVATNTWYFLFDIGTNCMFYSTATPPVPATWIGVQRSAGAFTTQAFGAVGITTSAFTSPINVARLDNKVTFPANRMIAVGGGGADVLARSANTPTPATTGTISYSDDDGATWAMVPGGATNAMFSSMADTVAGTSFGVGGSRGANAVAWNGEKWVAAGNGRTNSLAFSDDGGMTWTGITGKSVFSVEARDVAWNGRMWVAVGRGINFSTAYSYDGITWMGPVDASGTPINVFSLDIAGPTATMSDISGGGIHVVWTGKMWVATGTRTLIAGSSPPAYYTVAYSMDGKSWTGAPESGATGTGFDIYAHGLAWNGRNYVATGRGTVNTLAFSTDATLSWQGLGNSVFSVWGRGITWGARRWMATGRGTNTVAYSTNGRNWQGCGANVFKPMRRFMAMGDTGLYSGVVSGQPQRGVAITYSDDGVTWDAPVVNQSLEFSTPLGGASDATRSVIFTNNTLLTNTITDTASAHTALMYSTDAGSSWSRVPGTSDTEANGGTGMTVANRGSLTLASNTARTRFLVGGGDSASATRKVYFSNDGFNWRNGISSPNSTQMAWVSAALWVGGGYNRWLVGGSDATTNANGRIMYSGDADAVAAWIAASPATYTNTIISCFAANTDFSVILAGATSGNVIYRSVNGGANWTTVSISGTPTGSVMSIAFSPSLGRWVAVGGGGGAANTILYSTDATGTAWTVPPQGVKTAATAIFKIGSEVTRVIWDAVGARFLVGGWNGAETTAALTNVFGLDATLNNNPGYTMAYSANGVNWTPVTVRADASSSNSSFGPFLTRCRDIMALDVSGDFTPINTGYSVSWNSYANRFIATGNGTTPVVYSNDGGVTWTPANQQPPQQAIAVAGGASAAASTTSVSPLTYTIDGKIWSQGIGAKEIFGTGTVLALRYGQTSAAISPNGRIWVAGGTSTSGTSCLAFSQNGVRWTAITSALTMISNIRALVYAPVEQMIAVGGVNNVLTTATSGVGNGVWVAGGDTTNSLIFSYDGISWSEVPNSLTILSRCNACAFGNGLFVAGGVAASGSTAVDITANMAYSTDGINWQPIRGTVGRISSGPTNGIISITYGRDENGRGLWVAGAINSAPVSMMYSYNGIDWIGSTGVSSLSATVNSIAYGVNSSTGQGLWIAAVFRSSVYSFIYSTNGRDGWNTIPNTKTGLFEGTSISGASHGATSISYLNGVWYATGTSVGINTGRTLAYSYDGISGWFGVYPTSNIYGSAITTFSLTDMRCVATTADYIIPAGSSTGTAAASGVPSSLSPVRGVGWTAGVGSAYLQHPTLLVGVDSNRATTVGATSISADGGRSWGSSMVSVARSAFRGGVCNDAFWNGVVWAAVGYDANTGSKVAISKDGVSWTQIPPGNVPITGILYSIMWNGTVWMVGGDGSPTDDPFSASVAWSTNLITWTGIPNTDTKITITKRIAWNGMYWVAVGAGDVSTIMHSRDPGGLIWEDTYLSTSNTNKTASIISVVNDVVWGGGRWVAVGRGTSITGGLGVSILYSVDTPASSGAPAEYAVSGRRWTPVAGSAQLFPYGANSISWNGKRFIATGPAAGACSTGNIIAWSVDGISWNAYSTTKTVAPGQRWVAVGSGSRACIALSGDGRVWTDVSGSSVLFSDISGASAALVNTMKTGARAIGWNGNSLVVGGARSATTVTTASQFTATSTIGRTTIPVCAFIGSGNGVMGGGTTLSPDASGLTMRTSSSVFITHMDVNIRESLSPWSNMWLNTYTDLSATQLFQVTPDAQTFSSALKWNGWSWVANFGITSFHPLTGEQYGSIWYCTDPLARIGWSVASNSATPRILIGQGGYAALEWNGVAWLACGYDPNNNNLIYTTDKYGATGWTAVSGIVSGAGSASFQPVCIASSSRFWVVGGSQGASTSAIYFTSDRTGATGWRAVTTTGVGASVLPGIRITSVGYNGTAWICCGGGGGGTGAPASSISWRVDADNLETGWAAATISGTDGSFPPVLSGSSAIAYNADAASPIWVVVGDVTSNSGNQIAYTSTVNGSTEWKKPQTGTLTNTLFGRLNGIAWTGYAWIASSGAGLSRITNTTDITALAQWNNTTSGIFSPTLYTNAVTYVNIPISLLTTGMPTSAGTGAGTGAAWRAGVGRAQGLLPGGGAETTSVIVRSANGAEGTRWSQVYSRNFLIAVGGGVIRDAGNGGGTNRMAYSYDGGLSWTTNNTSVLTTVGSAALGTIRTVKYGNGMWVAGGDSAGSSVSGNNCLAWSRDGVNWVGAGGTQIFGSAGACYAVCCNDRGRWVAVGGAALGTAGTYTNTSGAIYTMAWSDDGMNWTPVLGSRALFGIVCQGVTYGADASGVGMWTAIGRGGAYTGCAYSYDGKTWYLSHTSGSLFGTSANVLTERYAPVASATWYSVSISSAGQYQTAVVSGGNIHTSSDYGVTWMARTTPGIQSWYAVSLSSTGQYQTAVVLVGQIHTSSDFGVNWTPRYSSLDWWSVSVSSSGQYQTAVVSEGQIYTSSDFGINWTPRDSNRRWRSVSLSSTGQYQTAVVRNGQIYTSSDFGINWGPRYNTLDWQSVSLSSTGQYQTAVVTGSSSKIHTSSDFGANWTPRYNNSNWMLVSISSTGQYQTAVVNGGQIHTSSNFGVDWTSRATSLSWISVSLSSTGQYQTAVVNGGNVFISSNFGETWSSGATDSRSLGVAYGKDASGVGMWVATAGRRDRDVATSTANTMAYSYDGKLWRGIRASAGLSEQAWSVAYGKDGFGVGMWVAGGYDTHCGLKWSYDGVTWNATMGASGAAVWAGAAAGRRVLSVYWNGSMWLASTSDTRNGEPRGTGIAANNASSVPGYLLYSYNGKNWLPVLAANTYAASITGSAQASVYSVLPNPAILDFGSFYDDQSQRGVTIANTTARTVGAIMSSVPIENINTIVPYGRGSLTTGQVPFLLGGDSGLVDTAAGVVGAPPPTSDLASTTTSLSTSTDGGITWRAVPNSTKVMTKVNKILCDETTQQIVAVGAGNYSVATSTPSRAADADGWTGVFGSRMTDTRAGLFEKYGTGASWFGGAKMWIASGRAQSRRGSSLAVSVNGTVWQDAKIVSQVAAGGNATLYSFSTFTFDNAGATGREGPELATVRTSYTNRGATWATTYLNMTTRGIQEWTVPETGSYTIRAVGAAGGNPGTFGRGRDIQLTTTLTKGEVIKILVGQQGLLRISAGGGGGGTFIVRGTQIPIIVAGGGGGGGASVPSSDLISNASIATNGNAGSGGGGIGGNSGGGGAGVGFASGGGGLLGSGETVGTDGGSGGSSFISGGLGSTSPTNTFGGFGGGGGTYGNGGGGGGGGGYSGGGGGLNPNSGGGGGSFPSTATDNGAINTTHGSVTITFNSTLIPYTSAATPLLTYTDSAAAFSTQVGSVAVNSQYNRAVVGGSGVQFVAGGRGGTGLVVSNDGQNWTAAAGAGAATVFQTPTNTTTRTGSGGFDASFGTVALTQRLTTPTTYPTGAIGISLSKTGQYQTTGSSGGDWGIIWTSSDYGVNWTSRATSLGSLNWNSISLSSTGQYQSAVANQNTIWTSSDFGVTWTTRTTPGNVVAWRGVSLSSTGQYQTAVVTGGNIWTSTDYGVNWTSRATSLDWRSVSVSSTGQYQTAVVYGGNIWISSDYGVSWNARSTGATRAWRSVSLSSTGQYQTAAADNGNIWTSSDYGVNWTSRATSLGWYGVSLSSTGQYQTAVVYSGNIWISSDFGVTWTERTTGATRSWYSVSLSSSGQYQSAGIDSINNIYTSSDFGVTWVQRSTATRTNAFTRIRSSASGQYQLATSGPVGDTNGQLYVSSDYGRTWMPRRGLATWLGGAVSATGGVMMAMTPAPPTTIKINNALAYSPILYLDATNPSSYNVSTNTWTNLGSLGGNVVMTNMGSFDSTDNGGSFNFNGTSDRGQITVPSTTLTSITYVAVVKTTRLNTAYATIIEFGSDILLFCTSTNKLRLFPNTPFTESLFSLAAGVWYAVAVTITSGGTTTYYVNGVSVFTSPDNASNTTNSVFGIGSGIGGNEYWSGKISSVAVYNRALTASEIYNLYISSALIRSTDYGNTFTDIPTSFIGTGYWRAIATTNSAAVQTAVAYGGSIYRSSDYGSTWLNTGITLDGNASANTVTPRNWQDIAVSAETGAVQVTCVSGGYLYISSDTGANWASSTVNIDGVAAQTTNRVWQAVAVSANGQYGLACVNSTTASGFLYRSTDAGASWSSSNVIIDGVGTQATNRPWQDVGMSANGKYQVACLNSNTQTSSSSTITSAVSVMVTPPGALATTFGSAWTQRGQDIDGEAVGDQSGYSVSLSADGTVVAVGAPMNFGANGRESGQVRVYALNAGVWAQRGADIDGAAGLSSLPMVVTATTKSFTGYWYSISVSSTGQYQSAVINSGGDGPYIYTSSDYGVFWTKRTQFTGGWISISVSSTGQYQSAVINSGGDGPYIYTSSDYGVFWTKRTQFAGSWVSISVSSTGQYQSAVINNGGSGEFIYTSSDYGVFWTKRTQFAGGWNSISVSSTGQYQSAVIYSGGSGEFIYTSSDYGVFWTKRTQFAGGWYSISVSSTGQYQSAVINSGGSGAYIYTSSDYGVFWTKRTQFTGGEWYSISVSSTGQYQSAVINSGGDGAYIYTSSDYGVFWTKRTQFSGYWRSISVNTTGQYQSAVSISGGSGAYIYFSRDYGFTWSEYASYEITEGDRFGTAVSLSANGNTVAVGSPYYDLSGIINRGQVRVFDWSGSAWAVRGTNILLGEGSNDYSGMSVSLSEDGKVVAVGAPLNDGAGNLIDSGHARVYAWNGSVWAQRGADIDGVYGLTSTNRVVTATGTSGSSSWRSVAMSSSGQYQTAGGSNGIYISSNYGVNWSLVPSANGAPTDGLWFCVSMSSSGQYQSAIRNLNNQLKIYVSNNFGVTWTDAKTFPTAYQSSISVSSTGQYQTANAEGEYIWRSSDYGVTWTGVYMVRNWQGISISSTGQYQTSVVSGGNIHMSSNFGANWVDLSANGAPTNANWYSVSISSTGQYQTACIQGNGSIYISSNFGANWTQVSAANGIPTNTNWFSVSISSTGQYQSAASTTGIYTSSNFGVNWTLVPVANGVPANLDWFNISVSATGQYQCAQLGGVTTFYFSRDYGFTWSEYASYEIPEGEQSGTSVSLSADGSVVAVGSPYADTTTGIDSGQMRVFAWTGSVWSPRGSPIFGESVGNRSGWSTSMSADGTTVAIGAPYNNGANGIGSGQVRVYKWSGSAWGAVGTVDIDGEAGVLTPPRVVTAAGTSGIRDWYSVAMSSSGQYQSAVVYGGGIYISSNYGVNWNTVDISRNWSRISMSSTGQYQTATIQTSEQIYISSNFGMTWTAKDNSRTWTGVSLSSTGQYQTAMVSGGQIYISSNYGNNWTAVDISRNWNSVSLSSTGQYQTAVVWGGGIYTSTNYGSNWALVPPISGPPSNIQWRGIALSSTGQYQSACAVGNNIYVSSNFGVNFASVSASNGAPNGINWYNISISSSGQYQTANISSGLIYISSNFGVSWTATTRTARETSMSSTGQYQTAVINGDLLYFSRDYGFTWSEYASYEVTTGGDQSGYSLSLSATGNSLAVGAPYNDAGATGADRGHVRVYDYNAATNLWPQRGADNDGEASNDLAGWSVSLSADGSTVAFGAPMNDGSGNLLPNSGSVRVFNVAVTNAITYTSSNSSVADVCGNLLIIKGLNGTTNITATQGATTTNGALTVSGTTYTMVYTIGVLSATSFIYYSKNYGASWTSLTAAGSRAWSSVALSENGSAISATTNDASGGVWVYSMPDDQYYRAAVVANSGSTTTPATVRAITYGNSGTGAATDGYWVAGADASANSLAYSSNGVDWTAVVGSKTTLFNAVNGVAYGADGAGTPMWVAVGLPFVGSVPGSTAFSIAYSYNMTTWMGVRNNANFTGQGNHVAYGQDEFGAGVWVAVGQGDGVLSANLGDSAFGASNGATGTTVFYSYDGANWAAGTGAGVFAVSGTDVAWGVDASGVGMWVATGIGYTDPLTGVVVPGGQVAHSTNGRVWTPIRTSAPITPAMTPVTLPATSRIHAIPPPPASTGFTASLYRSPGAQFGPTISGVDVGEQSGHSVSISADGMTVAVGAWANSSNKGVTRVYKYDPMTLTWPQLGPTISGVDASEQSGWSVSLSADGTTVAIGANANSSNKGITRIYKYNPTTNTWPLLGPTIPGVDPGEYSGASVSLSADGTTVAIGAWGNSSNKGITRVYKYNGSAWPLFGTTIPGVDASERSGWSVSLSADGTTVAVGAPINSGAAGVTRVYRYSATTNTWPLLGPTISGVDAGEESGHSVSISADGTTVAIGAYNNSSSKGVTRVYKYNGSTWPLLGPNILGDGTAEQSGRSVSLSADGMTVAIGARANSGNKGVTRVYRYNGSAWPQLTPNILGDGSVESFGHSVSLSADGTTVAVGAPSGSISNRGATRVYKIPVTNATFSSSNPAIAEINNGTLLIKDGASGTATITATQPATPPFTAAPVTVQGTLTVSGTTYTFVYNTFYPIFTPFPGAVAGDSPCVAYGRGGSQGTGAPLWIVANGSATGGAGGTNVFAMSSAPTTVGAWSVVASNAPSANAPFPSCNSIAYSNGVWVAGNNTSATNIFARSTDGGTTWTPVAASSVSGILTGAATIGANAFCNYSLAVADYSNDTNLRSWNAVQGTKNFFFEGGVSTVATVTPDVSASLYNGAWWVAGGVGIAGVASIGYTTDPSGATGWTKATSPAIAHLASINAIAFSPFTQRWLAVGAGSTELFNTNILYSDASGANWTSAAVSVTATPVITLNTCIWNQLPTPATISSTGRWLAGGTRNNSDDVTIANSACIYISTDVSGAATPWTPITGTGAILSQVYSIAYNGRVWIAAGAPATDSGSASTLMRTTTDPTGATGWQGIAGTNASEGGFDTAARSITWNADQQMWIATGESSLSSMIYSLDVSGGAGTWRTVRESNSLCFSGEGTGLAFTGDKWFASGEGNKQIVATTGANAASAATAPWSTVSHATALTRASDITYTGRRLIATGAGAGSTTGVILSTDNTGASWSAAPSTGFNDALGGGTSVNFEASYDGVGRIVATGRSTATNTLSVSTDGGATWTAPSTQFTSTNTIDNPTQTLFTTGGNSVAYVGNDTLFAGGGNDVHWTGQRWVAVGRNSAAASGGAITGSATVTPDPVDIINNNTTPVATSNDGITWQCVSTSQAPNLSEGTFLATNSRIGSTPLIDSKIMITDGGDTESNMDYGGMMGGVGGSGTGVGGIDIIAELTPVSTAASSISSGGSVGIIGAAGNGGANNVGNASTGSFDTTAFTITTRPAPLS